jgi:hypothetical protein
MPESLPLLRCEIERPSSSPLWLTWSLATIIVIGGLLDALWLVPAERARRTRLQAPTATEARVPLSSSAPVTRVDGVLLIRVR